MSIDCLVLKNVGENLGLAYGVPTKITLTAASTFSAVVDSTLFSTDVILPNLKMDSLVLVTLQDAVGNVDNALFAQSCWIVKATPVIVVVDDVDVIKLRIFFADDPSDYMTNGTASMTISTFYH